MTTRSDATGPLIARGLPHLPRTHGIDWGEAYFVSVEEFLTWFCANSIADEDPDWAEKVFFASDCRVTARITAQAWVRDTAMEVDAEGPDSWDIVPEDLDLRSSDLDFLKDSRNAPQWVRDWSGPFEIDLDLSDMPEASAHHRLRIQALVSNFAGGRS